MLLNERQSLIHRTYRLWGELFLNGLPITGSLNNNSTAPLNFRSSTSDSNLMTLTDTGITIERFLNYGFELIAKGGIKVDGRFVVYDYSNVTRLNIVNNSVFIAVPLNITNSTGTENVMRVTDEGVTVNGSLTTQNGNVDTRLEQLESSLAGVNTNALFGNVADSAFTRNAIGNIAANTTVGTLKTLYPTLTDILIAMLNIQIDMIPTGYKYSFVVPTTLDYLINTTVTFSLIIDVDRGAWSPVQSSGSSIPYGLPSSITGFSFANVNATWNLQNANSNSRVVRYTSTNSFSFTFTTLTTVSVQAGSVTLPAGAPAYNSNNVESVTSPRVLSSPSNSLSFRAFAHIYVGTNDNGTTINPSGDQRVYDTTSSITVNQQPQNSNVYTFKEPTALQVLDTVFGDYIQQTLGQFWTKTQYRRTTSPTVDYWRVSFVNNTVSTTQTIKILF